MTEIMQPKGTLAELTEREYLDRINGSYNWYLDLLRNRVEAILVFDPLELTYDPIDDELLDTPRFSNLNWDKTHDREALLHRHGEEDGAIVLAGGYTPGGIAIPSHTKQIIDGVIFHEIMSKVPFAQCRYGTGVHSSRPESLWRNVMGFVSGAGFGQPTLISDPYEDTRPPELVSALRNSELAVGDFPLYCGKRVLPLEEFQERFLSAKRALPEVYTQSVFSVDNPQDGAPNENTHLYSRILYNIIDSLPSDQPRGLLAILGNVSDISQITFKKSGPGLESDLPNGPISLYDESAVRDYLMKRKNADLAIVVDSDTGLIIGDGYAINGSTKRVLEKVRTESNDSEFFDRWKFHVGESEGSRHTAARYLTYVIPRIMVVTRSEAEDVNWGTRCFKGGIDYFPNAN